VSVKSARMISELADELERIQEELFVAQKTLEKMEQANTARRAPSGKNKKVVSRYTAAS
jgi:hypothetical protein